MEGTGSTSAKKQLYFLRHGESVFNKYYEEHQRDPMVFDAPLTDKGAEQAVDVRGQCSRLVPELIVTSPLRRALGTMQLAVPAEDHPQAKYEVWENHVEELDMSCDIGSPKAELIRDYPALDFADLPEVWWYTDKECDNSDPLNCRTFFQERGFIEKRGYTENRVNSMVARLCSREERVILVVGHANFFHRLLAALGRPGIWMRNCEVVEINIEEGVVVPVVVDGEAVVGGDEQGPITGTGMAATSTTSTGGVSESVINSTSSTVVS